MNRPFDSMSFTSICSALAVCPVLEEPNLSCTAVLVTSLSGNIDSSGRTLSLHNGAETRRLFHIVPNQAMRLIAQTTTGKESHIHSTLKNVVVMNTFPMATSGVLDPFIGIDASRIVLVLEVRLSQHLYTYYILRAYIAFPIALNTHAKLSCGVSQVSRVNVAENIAWSSSLSKKMPVPPSASATSPVRSTKEAPADL